MPLTLLGDFSAFKPKLHFMALKKWKLGTMVIAVTLAALGAWFLTGTQVMNLGEGNHMVSSGLQEKWARGDIVVMIRHAERCDRSKSTCLAGADGITVNGSKAAAVVGTGLQKMGLEKTRMIVSPLTRTQQTAGFIMGHAVTTQDWVGECDKDFKSAVLAHKRRGENLVLITHSGCIDHFEREMGVPAGKRSSAYTEAFFVKVDGAHAPKILGSLNASQWNQLTSEQLK